MTSVSVVIETVTARYDSDSGPLSEALAGALDALGRQTFEDFETIVVVDERCAAYEVEELRRRRPAVTLVTADRCNYFAAKNRGAEAARGAIVALLDGDCVPEPDWLKTLVARFEPGVSVVAGRTRYSGGSLSASTFSVPDFATVGGDDGGSASGFVINNVAFRREVLLAHPFEARIPRNGGCYLLYHQLRAAGATIVYEPGAAVAHGLDVGGLGFVRKHFDRGYDGMAVYRLDSEAVLRGTRLVRRFSALALAPIVARRIALDWVRLARQRNQIGISAPAVPYYAAVMLLTRLIELVGGVAATLGFRRLHPDRP